MPNTKSHEISGALQEANNLSNVFSDWLHIQVPFEVLYELESQ